MTINQAIIKFLENAGCGTFGTDLFQNTVPNSLKTPVDLWWFSQGQATVSRRLVTGEDVQRFPYTVYFRSKNQKVAEQKIFDLAKFIAGCRCYDLENFQTMEVQLTSAQQGMYIDAEERFVFSLQFTAILYDVAHS